MRRGFKALCERTANEYRQVLGVPLDEALDPRVFAAFLQVRVLTPQDIPGLSGKSLKQLTVTDPDSWSAVTMSHSGINVVILKMKRIGLPDAYLFLVKACFEPIGEDIHPYC